MIKAVIFDCFGVLVTNGHQALDEVFRPTPQQWSEISRIGHQADLGKYSVGQVAQMYAKLLGRTTEEVMEVFAGKPVNKPLLELIAQLKSSGYKIGFLSNISRGYLDDYFQKGERQLFDSWVLSNEVGLIKPDVRIYHLAANQLGLEPKNCLFIDDMSINVVGAQQAGMQAYQYKGLDDLKAHLANLNVELAS